MDYDILYNLAMPIRLRGYTNVDWTAYKANRLSISRFVFSLGSGAISWSNKKQPIIALLSTKVEYIVIISTIYIIHAWKNHI